MTNASVNSKLNDLKSQHIANEVKKVDDKVKKNTSDILGFESRLKQKKDIVDEAQRENSFNRGLNYYVEESYLVYKCEQYFFRNSNGNRITSWRASAIKNVSPNSDLKAIPNARRLLPIVEDNGRMNVEFNGNYFVQNKVLHPNNNKVVNIYIVYELDKINFTCNTLDYAIQDALFGAMKITKNATESDKNKYKGHGICFDSGDDFSIENITDGKNVLIFGVDFSNISTIHATNTVNSIYVLGRGLVQVINNTTIYAEKLYSFNFTERGKKFVLSLHYNRDHCYLFVNGTQELKFKTKDNQILKEKLCLGNLCSNWISANSTKTGLYGNVYDLVVDYEAINGVKPIYDMHRYLMTKHKI